MDLEKVKNTKKYHTVTFEVEQQNPKELQRNGWQY